MLQLRVGQVDVWCQATKKVSMKKSYKQHFSWHGRYREERSNSSTRLGVRHKGNYFNIPEPKIGFADEHDEPIIALMEGKLQKLIKDVIQNNDLHDYHMHTAMRNKLGQSPFSFDILNARTEKRFKQPELFQYDEVTRDPSLHV